MIKMKIFKKLNLNKLNKNLKIIKYLLEIN